MTKVMVVGDSLTAVDASALGYKGVMLDSLVAAGKSIDYVGSKLSTGPAGLKDPHHEGVSGGQVSTLLGQYIETVPLATKVTTYNPDVMTILIGVNDLWSDVPTATVLSRLDTVLTNVFAAKPGLYVVLCKIPLMGVAEESQRATYNTGVASAVTSFAAAGRYITLADLSGTLVGGDLQGDGIHWTSGGHTKVATDLYPTVLAAINEFENPGGLPPATGQTGFVRRNNAWVACGSKVRIGGFWVATVGAGGIVTPGATAWLRGASGDGTTDGTFNTWAGFDLELGGSWADAGPIEQVDVYALSPGGSLGGWTKPVDIAVGAIFKPQGESWASAAAGAYDARWTQMLQRIAGFRVNKGTTFIRFGHEFSLSYLPWSVQPSEVTDFITAWKRFHALKQSIFPAGKLVWCPNGGTDMALDIRNAWPGAQWVDVYGVDYYNSYPAVNTFLAAEAQFAAVESSGAPKGILRHWEQAQLYGVPFALCEWGTNGEVGSAAQGQDSPIWMQYLFDFFESHDDIAYECLFNVASFSNNAYGFYPVTRSPLAAAKYQELWPTRVGSHEPDPDPPPTPTADETWTGANADPWPATWTLGLNGTGTTADIQSNTGRLRTGTAAGQYTPANKLTRRLTTAPAGDFNAVFRFMNEASECYPSVCYRGDSTLDGNAMYQVSLNRTDATMGLLRVTAYSATQVASTVGNFVKSTAGTWYWCRIKVLGNSHKLKLWSGAIGDEPLTGGADGAGFQTVATDTTYATGNFGFSQNPGGVGQSNFYVDDLTIT